MSSGDRPSFLGSHLNFLMIDLGDRTVRFFEFRNHGRTVLLVPACGSHHLVLPDRHGRLVPRNLYELMRKDCRPYWRRLDLKYVHNLNPGARSLQTELEHNVSSKEPESDGPTGRSDR